MKTNIENLSNAANNLYLSVINDGNVYETRKKAIFALLAGAQPAVSIKNLVRDEAVKQRSMGEKFSLKDIKQASEAVHADTLEHCLELIRDDYNGDEITATCRKWFDKINGNTYFAVNVKIGRHQVNIPFQYGYGSHWESETKSLITKVLKICVIDKINFIEQGFMNKNMLFNGLYI